MSYLRVCRRKTGRGQTFATREAEQMRRKIATGEGITVLGLQHKINIFRWKKIRRLGPRRTSSSNGRPKEFSVLCGPSNLLKQAAAAFLRNSMAFLE